MKRATHKLPLKKLVVLTVLVLCLMVTSFPVFAGSISTETDATMTPGPIEITQVPTFTFSAYLKDYDLGKTPPMSGVPEGYILVEDARGSDKSWTIKATVGELKGTKKKNGILSGAVLSLPAVNFEPVETIGTSFKGYPVNLWAGDGIYHTIAISPPAVKGGLWKGTFASAAFRPVVFTSKFDTYKAVMYWSIEDTP